MKESDLFPIVKTSFKNKGYKVFAEVAHYLRGIDLVAVKDNDHVAVELKLSFNDHVVRQAGWDCASFDRVYVAFPVKKPIIFHLSENYWKLRESIQTRYNRCCNLGIGILEILPTGTIFEALEAAQQKNPRRMDFSHYKESNQDLGGTPNQKGVSAGYYELENIKDYVRMHPTAKWQEIWENVHNHYSSAQSLSGSMSQWRGFNLRQFKKSFGIETVKIISPKTASLL